MFQRLENRYIFKGRVALKTGLHIGSGKASLESDSPVMKDSYGRPFIPGSSFKGILRSHVERIVPNLCNFTTCGLTKQEKTCCATVNKEKETEFKELWKDERIAAAYELLCDTCKLFGSTLLTSKIKIPDLLVKDPWLDLFEIRDSVAIDRDTETAVDGAKFDYEVVPSKTEFEFEAIGENLNERDRFLLSVGLLEMMAGNLSLGGITSRGLGRFSLIIDGIFWVDFGDPNKLFNFFLQEEGKQMEEISPDAFIRDSIGRFLKEGGVQGVKDSAK